MRERHAPDPQAGARAAAGGARGAAPAQRTARARCIPAARRGAARGPSSKKNALSCSAESGPLPANTHTLASARAGCAAAWRTSAQAEAQRSAAQRACVVAGGRVRRGAAPQDPVPVVKTSVQFSEDLRVRRGRCCTANRQGAWRTRCTRRVQARAAPGRRAKGCDGAGSVRCFRGGGARAGAGSRASACVARCRRHRSARQAATASASRRHWRAPPNRARMHAHTRAQARRLFACVSLARNKERLHHAFAASGGALALPAAVPRPLRASRGSGAPRCRSGWQPHACGGGRF